MSQQDALLILRTALLSGVVVCIVSTWILIGQLQAKRPDLYERLGRPTAILNPFSLSTYKFSLFAFVGYPEFSPKGLRLPLWVARVLLPACILAMLQPGLFVNLLRSV